MLLVTRRPAGPSVVGTVMTWDGVSVNTDGPSVAVLTPTSAPRTVLGVVWREVGARIWLASAGWFVPPPSLTAGSLVYLFSEACVGPPRLLDVGWFGARALDPDAARAGGAPDSLPAFEAAIAASGAADPVALPPNARSRLQNQVGTVRVPPGSYRLSAPLQVWRPCSLRGAGPDITTLVFVGSTGIVVTAPATLNETAITGAAPVPLDKSKGQDAVIAGLTIQGPGPTVSRGAGVFMNARATLDSLHVTEFRTGIHVWASGEPQFVPGLAGGGSPVTVTMRVHLKPGVAKEAAIVTAIKAHPSSGSDIDAVHVLWVGHRPSALNPLARTHGPVTSSSELEVRVNASVVDPGPPVSAMDDTVVSGVRTLEYSLQLTPLPGSTFPSCSVTFNTPSHTLMEYASLRINTNPASYDVDGVSFDVDYNPYGAANSNDWRILYCHASNCEIGMHVHGQESSAGLAVHYFGDGEMRWALIDSSFLNATYVATHLEGAPPAGTTAGSLLSDGAVNRSVFLGTYIEGALGAPVLRGPALFLGGALKTNFEDEPAALPILARSRPLPWLTVEPNGAANKGLQVALGARPQALDGGGRPGLLLTPNRAATGGGADIDAALYYMNTFDLAAPAIAPASWYAFKVRDDAGNDAFRVTGGFHPDGAGHFMLRSGSSLGTELNLAMRQFVTPSTPERLTGTAFRPGDIIWSADPHTVAGGVTVNGWRCLHPGAFDAPRFATFAGTARIGDILSDGTRVFRCSHILRRDPVDGTESPRKECANIPTGMLAGGGNQTALVTESIDGTPTAVTYVLQWNDAGEAWPPSTWQVHFRAF